MNRKIRVLVCGAGSGSHALAGTLSLKPDVEVRVFINDVDKVRRWNERANEQRLAIAIRQEDNDEWVERLANPFTISADPETAARDCDIIFLVLPAFLHLEYLKQLAPHIEKGCLPIGLPGQTGFEFDARHALGAKIDTCILMNFESLPWVCRTVEFGKAVNILSSKARLAGALQGNLASARLADPLACLQYLLGSPPELVVSGHLLGISLLSPNAYSHPPITYARWKEWDGETFDRAPLFYHGVDDRAADLIYQLSEEVLAIAHRIEAKYPQVDLSQVIPIAEWDIAHYGKYIADKTNYTAVLRTNAAYEGITHPTIQKSDGSHVPNFNHRFLTEDLPFGLVVIRGIAEIVGVQTPYTDLVLAWGQEKLGKAYLVGDRLVGKDLDETRCPQRYGFATLPDILGLN